MGGTATPVASAAPQDDFANDPQQQDPQQQQQPTAPTQQPAPDPGPGSEQEASQGGGAPAPAAAPTKPGLFSSVLNAVSSALGGPQTVSIARNPQTGAIEVTRRDSTSGEKWGRILQAGLQGLGAGLAQPSGPGQLGRAAGASIQAGMQGAQQRQQQMRTDANQDFDETQKAQLHNAQMALLGTQNATAAFDLTQKKTQAFDGFLQAQNAMHDVITSNSNNRMIGNVPSSADLPELQKTDPNIIKDFYAGKIKLLPHVNEDGTMGGIDVYHVEQDWQKQMNREPLARTHMVAGKNIGDPPQLVTDMLPANSINNGDYMKLHDADTGAILLAGQKKFEDDQKDKVNRSEIARNNAEAGDASARAGLARAQASILQTGPGSPAGNQGVDLVEGNMDPTQLNKRAKDYDAKLDAARSYSMQKYGVPFDLAQAQTDYRYANQKGTQDTLNYLNSLTGKDGSTGNLAVLRAQSAALPRSEFPPLNDVTQWVKLMSGNPAIAAYHATLTETADQVAKILQGGGSGGGGTSDAKMKQANDLFKAGFSNGQMQAVISDLQPLLQNRKLGLIGDNRYLRKQYLGLPPHPTVNATPTQPAAAGTPQPPQATATPTQTAQPGKSFAWDSFAKAQ